MSGSENEDDKEEEKLFYVEHAKTGRAKCKKCKNQIENGALRLAKVAPNPFGTGMMKVWHHLPCIFEVFKRQRASTPKIQKIDDIGGYESLKKEDIEEILKFLPDDARTHWESVQGQIPVNVPLETKPETKKKKIKTISDNGSTAVPISISQNTDPSHRDNSLRQFRKICLTLSEENSSLQKTRILKEFFDKGSDGTSFKGDLLLWVRFLLPMVEKTVYFLNSKKVIKIFSQIFETDSGEMCTHLEKGDLALTISEFFQKSNTIQPVAKSTLSLQEVDKFLKELPNHTKEEEQQNQLTKIAKKCTANDLQIIIRFIKHDLRINAGPKPILDALHPDAYEAFKTCRDIDSVINRITEKQSEEISLKISVKLLTPIQPMLAQACSSLDAVLKKYPNGLFTEIKYDGERVQLHKQGSDFKYFSRSLKPVLPHKVNHFRDYINKAFPTGDDLIIDCEVLMIDTKTGDPLPFGTLGKHKKNEFTDANPCLYVFDCLYFNGKTLLDRPFSERRSLLLTHMTKIPNHIEFSETKLIKSLKDMETTLTDVLNRKLEGLVLKDPEGVYEPGKRRWIKVKRDYLFEGKAADTVDLVVVGAYYGTGHKGGMMNVFLMGCYNPDDNSWRTVTKVHGHDDNTLKALQTELNMVKVSHDITNVPSWLKVSKPLTPDFVARDPKNMPVWEVTCHEFTKHDVHTADGISMRFPRVTKVRHDKNWKTATTLAGLKKIFEISKTNVGSRLLPFLNSNSTDVSPSSSATSTPVKRKRGNESDVSDISITPTKSPPKKQRMENTDEDEKDFPIFKRKKLPNKPLPDLLAGKIIELQDSSEDIEFRRHLIAYGATIVNVSNKKATHRVNSNSFSIANNSLNKKIMKIQLEKIKK